MTVLNQKVMWTSEPTRRPTGVKPVAAEASQSGRYLGTQNYALKKIAKVEIRQLRNKVDVSQPSLFLHSPGTETGWRGTGASDVEHIIDHSAGYDPAE